MQKIKLVVAFAGKPAGTEMGFLELIDLVKNNAREYMVYLFENGEKPIFKVINPNVDHLFDAVSQLYGKVIDSTNGCTDPNCLCKKFSTFFKSNTTSSLKDLLNASDALIKSKLRGENLMTKEEKFTAEYSPKSMICDLEGIVAGTPLYAIRISDMSSGTIVYDPNMKPDMLNHFLFSDPKEKDQVFFWMQNKDGFKLDTSNLKQLSFTGTEIKAAFDVVFDGHSGYHFDRMIRTLKKQRNSEEKA